MIQEALHATSGLEEPFYFESWMAELSSRFVALPANLVDRANRETLRVLCECLDLDSTSLWEQSPKDASTAFLTQLCQRGGRTPVIMHQEADLVFESGAVWDRQSPTFCRSTDFNACFPWVCRQVRHGQTIIISTMEDLPEEATHDRAMFLCQQTRSIMAIPLSAGGKWLGCLMLGTTQEERHWPEDMVRRFQLVAHLMANALARKHADQDLREFKQRLKLAEEKFRLSLVEIENLKNRLRAESDYLEAETKVAGPCGAITGQSEGITKVVDQVRKVAPTDATVLVCGETGVGKELVAEAVHGLSQRKDRRIVKVSCAALPPALVESELFGREKGAYTGALARQIGRFEIADNSSIFLDEIGELSLEAQAKLLRVLEEGQFERLGSPKTIKVNVRLIAATNRDLAEEVRKGRFRQDLFYRLNVFPIRIPPLRERLEDIPSLVRAFVAEFSARMGRRITKISRKTMETLQRYSWPGNARELRNAIERSLIIGTGDTLQVAPLQELQPAARTLTLAESEREYIVGVLESTFWRVKGPRGAADVLGLKPSTLYTRMQKLNIPNRRQKDGGHALGRHSDSRDSWRGHPTLTRGETTPFY